MAGGAPAGSSYSPVVGFIFIFNLVVGVGSLTLPRAFAATGLILSSLALTFFAFLAYVTVTFLLEAEASANAKVYLEELNSEGSLDYSQNTEDGDPLLIGKDEDMFKIRRRIEVVDMAEMFLGKRGTHWFLVALSVYLFGDLMIYAVAVPKTLYQFFNEVHIPFLHLHLTGIGAYRFFVLLFGMFVVPFCFFNFANTKYLQYFTMFFRNLAAFTMIVCASIFISRPSSASEEWGVTFGNLPLFKFSGLGDIFGAAVYAFMCHHSIPGIIAPMRNKSILKRLFAIDYVFILLMNLAMCFTAVIAFGNAPNEDCKSEPSAPCKIQDLYTLNFKSFHIRIVASVLVLYPVFTITSNYPLIAITFRNNILALLKKSLASSRTASPNSNTWRTWLLNPKVISAAASIPPIGIALCTTDLGRLVSLTGAIGGSAIQYLIPACLVFASRRYWRSQYSFDSGSSSLPDKNPFASPFQHRLWPIFFAVWSIFAIVVSIVNLFKH